MSKDTEAQTTGMTFLGTLLTIFVILKVTGNVDWPWWLVLAPLWVPIWVAAVLLIVVGIVAMIVMAKEKYNR